MSATIYQAGVQDVTEGSGTGGFGFIVHLAASPLMIFTLLWSFKSIVLTKMEPFMSMRDCFPKMGISPYRRVTYKMAVKEGWAPAPTNDYQKAIWDKVKAAASPDPTARWKSDFGGKKPEGKAEGK